MTRGRDLEVDYFGEVIPKTEKEKASARALANFVSRPENRKRKAPLDDEQERIARDFRYAIDFLNDPARQPRSMKPVAAALRDMVRKKMGIPAKNDPIIFTTAVHSSFDIIHRADGFMQIGDTAYLLDVTANPAKGPSYDKAFPEYDQRRGREVLIIPEIDEPPEEFKKLLNIYSQAIAVGLFLELKREKRKELWQESLPVELKAAVLNRVFKLYGADHSKTIEILTLINEQETIDIFKSNQELTGEAEEYLLVQLGKEKSSVIIRENFALAKRSLGYHLGYEIPMQETRLEKTVIRRRAGVPGTPR